eukprot:TRINITY_DN1852_c0_g1_i1.p1 TRINITY_DN1852_c0_g1~~TRINITY_DN1852_c0_g1_i1.p1  ORF type:complete len:351 (+),score=57.79 TRINITY_DN1852_c0_g1_i1:190-1242(+)
MRAFLVATALLLVTCVLFVEGSWYGLTCDAQKGISGTLPLCSEAQPCTELNPLYKKVKSITVNQFPTTCKSDTVASASVLGLTRYYCEYIPSTASPSTPVPLVLWFPGSGANASSLYTSTKIRSLAKSFDLSQGNGATGFALVSFQPLNRHWPTGPTVPFDGTKQDFLYYDPPNNSDYVFTDVVIDALAATGKIDTNRIYTMGWSNGAYTALQYSISRSGSVGSTPNGHKIAALAVYSGSDPFLPTKGSAIGKCTIPYPTSTNVPIYIIGKDCDIVPCSGANTWVSSTLPKVLKNPINKRVILDSKGKEVSSCASKCNPNTAISNHLVFPPQSFQEDMLTFLANNPLNAH